LTGPEGFEVWLSALLGTFLIIMAHVSTWLSAARPKTLSAAFAPVLIGWGLAASNGAFDWRPAAICLAFALLVQIGTNFANDYADARSGADGEKRKGPVRAVAAGLITPAAMKAAAIAVLALAFCLGLALIPFGGWWLLAVGIACVACGWLYTGGPYPLAYNGLGDLFVVIFFGFVAVGATYYVQAGFVSKEALVLGLACGLLVNNILVVNNTRDAEEDEEAGKRTLVVVFGRKFGFFLYMESALIAGLAVFWLQWRGHSPLLYLALLPVLWAFLEAVRLRRAEAPADYDRRLAAASGVVLFYAVPVALGLAF
jgi:1,4-dihydroxy-2-naphthoate octaprenyltransferase